MFGTNIELVARETISMAFEKSIIKQMQIYVPSFVVLAGLK